MDGIWEAPVKSVKRALKFAIKDRLFTEEVLYTTLCEIEPLLNNRPLASISADVSDNEWKSELSPNFSPEILTDKDINLRRKWRSVQAPTQFLEEMVKGISALFNN